MWGKEEFLEHTTGEEEGTNSFKMGEGGNTNPNTTSGGSKRGWGVGVFLGSLGGARSYRRVGVKSVWFQLSIGWGKVSEGLAAKEVPSRNLSHHSKGQGGNNYVQPG